MTITEFQRLKDRVEQTQRDADRAVGVLEQSRVRPKKKFNCRMVEGTEAVLNRLRKRLEKHERIFERLSKRFEKKHGDRL